MSFGVGSLNWMRLQDLPIPKDFTFIIKGKKIEVPQMAACLISPKVVSQLQSDASANSFKLDEKCSAEHFEALLAVFQGGTETGPTVSSAQHFLEIGKCLGNDSLVDASINILKDSMSTENIFEIVNSAIRSGISSDFMIDFLASNFTELSEKWDFDAANIDILRRVLMSDKLEIANQSSLACWIRDTADKHGSEYRALIECVDFDELTYTDIAWLFEDDDFQLTSELLRKLKPLLARSFSSGPVKFKFTKTYRDGHNLDGVFAEMRKILNGNPMDKGEIMVNVPTCPQIARDLLEYEGDGRNHHWKNEAQAHENYIIFDFMRHKLCMTGYTIRGCYCSKHKCRPKEWEIAGSNDSVNWTKLSESSSTNMDSYAVTTVTLPEPSVAYRYIRYTQKQNWDQLLVHIVHLSAFEFFGTVLPNQ